MNFKTQTMVFIGENTVSVDAVPIDQVVVNRDIEMREVDRSIQFKLYKVPNSSCADILYAVYSNPTNKPTYQLKTELLPCINIPQDKMVVMGDPCELTPIIRTFIARLNPNFEREYRGDQYFIPVFRFTAEEVDMNRNMFRYRFSRIPYGRVVSFDYDGWDERFYEDDEEDTEDEDDDEVEEVEEGEYEEDEDGEEEIIFDDDPDDMELDTDEEEDYEYALREHVEGITGERCDPLDIFDVNWM